MNVGQICGGRLVKASKNAPLSEIAGLMSTHHVGAVVVTEGKGPRAAVVGIITDRDIVSAQLAQAMDLGSLSAEGVMTRKVLTLDPGESIDGAIAHMRARGVRRAPVVSADGVAVGMISIDDLLAQLAFKLINIAGIVARQTQRER